MDIVFQGLVDQINEQIRKLEIARNALTSSEPMGNRTKLHTVQASGSIIEPRRVMSAEARKRIGLATKKRWAAKRKADAVAK